jgi:hypothetical protein
MLNRNKRVIICKLIAFFFFTTAYASSNNIENCLIGNEKYQNEFLTNDESNEIFLGQSVSIEDLETIKWSLIQLNDMEDTYYLRNKNTGHYLCSMTTRTKKFYQDLIDYKRSKFVYPFVQDHLETHKLVTVSDESHELLDHCKWIFERAGSDVYVIWNMHYKEALYGGNLNTGSVKYRRNVLLVNKLPKGEEFKWAIEC